LAPRDYLLLAAMAVVALTLAGFIGWLGLRVGS
jgi:hypothetical protein